MSADTRLRSFIDRVLHLKAEQDELAADIREVYAEAKAEGFDKTTMGVVVAHLRRVDKRGADVVAENQSMFDLYLQAYESAVPGGSHAHTCERDAENSSANSSEPNRVDCRLTNDERPAAATAGGEGDVSSPSADTEMNSPTVASPTGDPSGHLSKPSPDAVPATDGAREGAVSLNGQSGQERGLETQGRNEPASVASPSAGVNDGEGASVSSPSIPTYAPSPPAPPRPSDEDLAIPSFLRRGHPDCRFNDSQREPAQ